MDKKQFYEMCLNEFRFLIDDYGFRVKSKSSDSTGHRVLFQNATTAVYVFFENRERLLDMRLCKLVDGEFVPDWISVDAPRTCFSIWRLASIRKRKLGSRSANATDEDIARDMAAQAAFVRDYAQDVLRGDFSVFDELDHIVKENVPSRPPSMD